VIKTLEAVKPRKEKELKNNITFVKRKLN